jgi:glycosyltransferase involved in cell wall biosynthesis
MSLISVVIPTYQHAKSLPHCLESLFAQTHKEIEIIVVNDGSTDDTVEVLVPYEGCVQIIHQKNQGANPARNRGLKEAKGEFVIVCDADVTMRPDMLEKLKDALDEHADASYAYSAFRFGWKLFRGVPFDANQLKERNFIHTTSLVRRKDHPGFDNDVKRFQDWDVWLTMLEAGKTGILVDEVLCQVAIDGESRIGSSWLPSVLYRLPWKHIGWAPKRIRTYEAARAIIVSKHSL